MQGQIKSSYRFPMLKQKREDGQKTREKLLRAASRAFAEKGFHETRVATICKRAGTNVAAVNYYFGSKAGLYAETWRYTYLKADLNAPPQETAPDRAGAEKQLSAFIHDLVRDFSNQGKIGQLNRLFILELISPTGLIDDTIQQLVEPRRERLQNIIAKVAGPGISHQQLIFCEMSVMNQCRIFLTTSHQFIEFAIGQPIDDEIITRIAEHISAFSIAGIQKVCGTAGQNGS